jgi:hypothetical protein
MVCLLGFGSQLPCCAPKEASKSNGGLSTLRKAENQEWFSRFAKTSTVAGVGWVRAVLLADWLSSSKRQGGEA